MISGVVALFSQDVVAKHELLFCKLGLRFELRGSYKSRFCSHAMITRKHPPAATTLGGSSDTSHSEELGWLSHHRHPSLLVIAEVDLQRVNLNESSPQMNTSATHYSSNI